jgi:hypothetical protein
VREILGKGELTEGMRTSYGSRTHIKMVSEGSTAIRVIVGYEVRLKNGAN